MPAIDLVQWSPSDSRPVFAYRYPETNISNFAQLIVHESQEAILFSKGRLVGKYGPGKHTLSTENLPVLRDFFKIPFGKNPFFAEVWFVNKLLPLNIDWNTGAMMHHDPDYMTMVPIRAHGRYGLRVDDAERFLIQLVGTAREFTAQQLTDHFKGELESKTKTAILQFMLAQRIGIKSINACLAPLSDALQAVMIPFWEQYGFGLAGFYVTSVEVDNDGEAGRRILDAMGRQSAQVIAGYSWQQERALDVAKEAARHSGGGLLGALMMTNLVGGAGSYDYDTTPNEQSGMGFTGASGTPVPSTAVLGAMAALILGAAGVRKWNRARA